MIINIRHNIIKGITKTPLMIIIIRHNIIKEITKILVMIIIIRHNMIKKKKQKRNKNPLEGRISQDLFKLVMGNSHVDCYNILKQN